MKSQRGFKHTTYEERLLLPRFKAKSVGLGDKHFLKRNLLTPLAVFYDKNENEINNISGVPTSPFISFILIINPPNNGIFFKRI